MKRPPFARILDALQFFRAESIESHGATEEAALPKEFLETVRRLNLLYSYTERWRVAKARRDTVDHFGQQIQESELYYYRKSKGRLCMILSRESLSRMFTALFDQNYRMTLIEGELDEAEKQEAQEREALARDSGQ